MNENTDEIYEKVMNSGILEQGIKIGMKKGREIGREEGIEKGIKEGRFSTTESALCGLKSEIMHDLWSKPDFVEIPRNTIISNKHCNLNQVDVN